MQIWKSDISDNRRYRWWAFGISLSIHLAIVLVLWMIDVLVNPEEPEVTVRLWLYSDSTDVAHLMIVAETSRQLSAEETRDAHRRNDETVIRDLPVALETRSSALGTLFRSNNNAISLSRISPAKTGIDSTLDFPVGILSSSSGSQFGIDWFLYGPPGSSAAASPRKKMMEILPVDYFVLEAPDSTMKEKLQIHERIQEVLTSATLIGLTNPGAGEQNSNYLYMFNNKDKLTNPYRVPMITIPLPLGDILKLITGGK